MSDRPNGSCAICGKPIHLRKNSLPSGQARCRPCWHTQMRDARPHGLSRYQRGCRCEVCRRANTLDHGARRGVVETERACRICGTLFTSRTPRQWLCSDDCRRQQARAHSSAYRASRRAGRSVERPVIPSRIFDRDRWRCHICRRKLTAKHKWPHPWSPSIDHLLPLTRGGEHVPENVATACLRCNIAKSNRGGNEQLLLIG